MPRKKNIATQPQQTTPVLAESFKRGIDERDICSVEEFLFVQAGSTESEFKEANPEQYPLIVDYISRRRAVKIRELEKFLINGTATANQIRAYDILVSIDNGTQDNGNNRHEDLYNAIFGSNKE